MEFHTNLFIFSGLAIFMIVAALFAVVSSKIMRAATLLLLSKGCLALSFKLGCKSIKCCSRLALCCLHLLGEIITLGRGHFGGYAKLTGFQCVFQHTHYFFPLRLMVLG